MLLTDLSPYLVTYEAKARCIVCRKGTVRMGDNLDDLLTGLGKDQCPGCGGQLKLVMVAKTVEGEKQVIIENAKPVAQKGEKP